MSDDPNYDHQQRLATLQMAEEQKRLNEINEVVKHGQETFGTKSFDAASNKVASRLGPERTALLREALPTTHIPADIVTHLSDNETRLDEMSRMSGHDFMVELYRIEAERGGRNTLGAEPNWKTTARGATEQEWSRNGGDHIKDDAAWNRAFDKHLRERSGAFDDRNGRTIRRPR
jgi:hypothetical protein